MFPNLAIIHLLNQEPAAPQESREIPKFLHHNEDLCLVAEIVGSRIKGLMSPYLKDKPYATMNLPPL